MKRITIIAVILLFLSVNLFATKRALVIGLGQQKYSGWKKINGDNDVNKYIIPMLNTCGYRGNITSLVNRDATKNGIVNAFNTLAKQCKPGDIVYIHFSGHGQRVVDGNEFKRNSWIPYDACSKPCSDDNGNKHLMDYEINRLLHKIVNKIGSRGKLLVAVDACFSASSTRGDEDVDEDLNEEEGATARFAEDDFIWKSKVFSQKELKSKWIEISACKEYEYAWEINQYNVGRLSYAIYNVANKGRVEFSKIEKFVGEYQKPKSQTPNQNRNNCSYNIWDVLK